MVMFIRFSISSWLRIVVKILCVLFFLFYFCFFPFFPAILFILYIIFLFSLYGLLFIAQRTIKCHRLYIWFCCCKFFIFAAAKNGQKNYMKNTFFVLYMENDVRCVSLTVHIWQVCASEHNSLKNWAHNVDYNWTKRENIHITQWYSHTAAKTVLLSLFLLNQISSYFFCFFVAIYAFILL